ncbi:hypothetical protein BGX23_004395, partial [Mortierella sp. AD031]
GTFEDSVSTRDTKLQDSSRSAAQEHGLIPLAYASITEGNTPFKDEIDDVAFAFSQTLLHLTVLASTSLRNPTRRIHIGQGWVDLPLLTHLTLDADRARLMIDSQLLLHCPNVESVVLSDKTIVYHCQDT